MSSPDFAALRAARNAKHEAWEDEMRAEGWQIVHACHDANVRIIEEPTP